MNNKDYLVGRLTTHCCPTLCKAARITRVTNDNCSTIALITPTTTASTINAVEKVKPMRVKN